MSSSLLFAVLGYATCSSLMLVTNKLAVHHLPAPSFVLLAQVACSWAAVKLCGLCGLIEVDELQWNKLSRFFFVSVAFLASIFSNIKTLQYANVETFIVFRAATPVVISVLDWLLLGRELPGLRSVLAIAALIVGAAAYVATDAAFEARGGTIDPTGPDGCSFVCGLVCGLDVSPTTQATHRQRRPPSQPPLNRCTVTRGCASGSSSSASTSSTSSSRSAPCK